MVYYDNLFGVFSVLVIYHFQVSLKKIKAHLLWQNTLNPEEHYLAVRKQSNHISLSSDLKLTMDQKNT